MNKLQFIIVACAIIISSCNKENETIINESYYTNGALIINEGNYGTANSSISYYNYATDEVEQDIYFKNNNVPIAEITNPSAIPFL